VMFVAGDPAAAVEAALDLVEEFERDDTMPPARAGLAYGPVLPYGGDCFGPVVNLAARIVEVARPSTAVAPAELHDRLSGQPALEWRRLPPKRLKGIGRTPLWAVARAGRLPRSRRRASE
jgi:adenylate cyclase